MVTCIAQPFAAEPVRLIASDSSSTQADAIGSDCSGGIHANPTPIGNPDLTPGVCVRLTHQQVVTEVVPVATLIAGHHTRRNAGGAHEYRKSRRIVFAETFVRGKQEVVHRIATQWRRRQRARETA